MEAEEYNFGSMILNALKLKLRTLGTVPSRTKQA